MKKEVVFATIFYTLSLLILFVMLFWFLKKNGFHEDEFIIGSSMLLFIAVGLGYIVNCYILTPKFRIDENLLHLVKEIFHELNIPLSTIKANSAMLKKKATDEKTLLRLERIDGATLRLHRLYTELIYNIKKEIAPIEKERFLLRKLIQERVDAFRDFGRNEFELFLEDIEIFADKIGFEKVVDNLISNAMKYSDKTQSIKIMLQNNTLIIEDKGIGMDETQLVTVFERYYQLDSTAIGEGIGLAIVKSYCDNEKIKVSIYSKKNEGTRVLLNLSKVRL
ncbi:MAG: HAMP domain-containing histidine kinase [Epsilonproteobacteria bacterium]|nr:HAMP domain-containing histidine kinase [Campylobacterota bacterium]MBD3839551.1 HAMP domain-containing histidine kinase [Campylobacterota bacterium]